MSDSNSFIKLTEEELDDIVKCFESDREFVSRQQGNDSKADMLLQLFKTFRNQIMENQNIAERLRDRKQYHLLCQSRFEPGSGNSQYHHAVWKELESIENED